MVVSNGLLSPLSFENQAWRTTRPSCQQCVSFSSNSSPPSSRVKRRRRLKEFTWVPPAYRGGDVNKRGPNRPSKPPSSWKRGIGPTEKKQERRVKTIEDKQPSNAEWKAIREKERRLILLYQDFSRQVIAYQALFCPAEVVDEQPDGAAESPKRRNFKMDNSLSNLNELADNIRTALQGVQDADVPVDEAKLKATEEDFVALCRTMQHMCSTSCSLSQLTNNEKTFTIFVDIAEQILVELIRLLQERCLLIDSAHTWGDEAKRPVVTEGKEGHRKIGVSQWLNTIVKTILSPISQDKHRDQARMPREMIGDASMSEAGKRLDETTERLLSILVNSIITYTTNQLGDITLGVVDPYMPARHRKLLENAGDRVLSVLENAPTSWDATNEALNKAIQLLAGAASYESAKKCKMVFERHRAPHSTEPRLSSVLQAYLSAIKHTNNPRKSKLAIVEEAYDFFNSNFDQRMGFLSSECLQAVSVMLQIMTVDFSLDDANENSTLKQARCEMANSLLKNATGDDSGIELLRQVKSDDKSVSAQLTPLLDPLACLYAISEDPERIELAHKMLDHMVESACQGRISTFPSTNTCNAVLHTIVCKHETKPKDTGDKSKEDQEEKADLQYSKDLMAFMYKRKGADLMPNRTSLKLAYRLLKAIEPDDEVVRAQDILSMAEAHYLVQETGSQKSMGMTCYHETLQTWLRVASSSRYDPITICPAEQVLWLVDRMEIRSTPAFLTYSLLKNSAFPYLYDTRARPTKLTYELALNVCAASDKQCAKSSQAALSLARKMERRQLLDPPHIELLSERADGPYKDSIESFIKDFKKKIKQKEKEKEKENMKDKKPRGKKKQT